MLSAVTDTGHPRAGHPFELTDEGGAVAMMLDNPTLCRLNGLDPVVQLASWRLTGEREAERRGGLIFAGETRSGTEITRHYVRRTWWRVLWFALARPHQERQT